MRLTTLARKIDISPGQLIEFLEENDIAVANGHHTKLDQETINMVMEHFMPEHTSDNTEIPIGTEAQDPKQPEEPEKPVESDEPEPGEIVEEDSTETINVLVAKSDIPLVTEDVEQEKEPRSGTIEDLENAADIDLIKVKKVKLEGIKVVGKIELPEKPKKEEKAAADQEEEAEAESSDAQVKRPSSRSRKFDRNRKKNRRQHGRQSLSYEERMKEEEREKLKLRRRRENEEKRRKTIFYEKNIKPKTTPAPTKKKRKKHTTNFENAQPEIAVHKNPLIRFWEWLNGKYDRY